MVTSTRYSTDRHDKSARLIGVCVDSTSRVAKISLHEGESRFHAVLNGTFKLVGLLIKEDIVLEVKQTALNFCRLRPQYVFGCSCWEIWWTLIVSQQHLCLLNVILSLDLLHKCLNFHIERGETE
ncbi:hypothetical protein [Nostoc sp. UHCC 0252]|uniref:hypothetical protein n=1 Tax=Nostoc sp. UHCC 0252 TaxID=3110241 RepID=UPI002B21DB7B|nr:hypothetical protein [Nostoc sp. UHCC 0252]MEA5600777.1 hypothetical protein [Nostoc sp. UHCC 0252]